MSKKVKVEALTIQIGGETVMVTIEEARQLHSQLNELFGRAVEYVPRQPIIIERERWPKWICDGDSAPPTTFPQIWCHAGD